MEFSTEFINRLDRNGIISFICTGDIVCTYYGEIC